MLNEDNFKIIKGTDNKNYIIIVHDNYNNAFVSGTSNEMLVLNDELELVSKEFMIESLSPDYATHNGFILDDYIGNIPCKVEGKEFYKNNKYVKIENNEIHFLFPKMDNNSSLPEYLEERVYTINNNKLEYKVINTYKVVDVCQQL